MPDHVSQAVGAVPVLLHRRVERPVFEKGRKDEEREWGLSVRPLLPSHPQEGEEEDSRQTALKERREGRVLVLSHFQWWIGDGFVC